MKAIICDICGKIIDENREDVITIGKGFKEFDVCIECRDEVKDFVFALREQKGGNNE